LTRQDSSISEPDPATPDSGACTHGRDNLSSTAASRVAFSIARRGLATHGKQPMSAVYRPVGRLVKNELKLFVSSAGDDFGYHFRLSSLYECPNGARIRKLLSILDLRIVRNLLRRGLRLKFWIFPLCSLF